MTGGARDRLREASALAAIPAAVLLFYWRVLLGRVLVPWDILRALPPWGNGGPVHNIDQTDAVRLYASWRTLLQESFRAGRIPTWNPYVLGGTPFLANPQAAVLYPPNILYVALPVDWATTALILAHLSWGGIGAYALARVGLRVSRPPALVAGIGFMLGGFMTTWAEWPTIVTVVAWLPWLLLAAFRVADKRSPAAVAGLAVAVAMSILAGHTQFALYNLLAVVTVAVVLAATRLRTATPGTGAAATARARAIAAATSLLMTAVGAVAGLMLAAPQLLASLELGRNVVRQREAIEALLAGAFPLRLLPLVALPRMAGDSQLGNWRTVGSESEYVAFAGVVCLLLAPLALAWWRRPGVLAILAVEVLAWTMATGSPAFRLLYVVVPGLDQLRAIGRATSLHALALPLVAAVGLEVLLRAPADTRRRLLPALPVAGLVALGALATLDYVAGTRYLNLDRGFIVSQEAALLVAGAIAVAVAAVVIWRRDGRIALLLPLVLAGELYVAYSDFNTADPGPAVLSQPTSLTSALADRPARVVGLGEHGFGALTGNTAIAYHVSTPQGSDSLVLRDFADLYGLVEENRASLARNEAPPLRQASSLRSPVLDLLAVGYVMTPSGGALSLPTVTASAGEDLLARSGNYQMVSVACLRRVTSEAEVLAEVARGEGEARVVAAISADPAAAHDADCEATPSGREAPAPRGRLEALQVHATGTAEADVILDRPALVRYSQSQYPGWRAEIDGRSASLVRVDHALMGVVVPSGRHSVRFEFVPRQLGLGLMLAGAAALAILAVCSVAPLRRGLQLRRARDANVNG